MQKKRGRILDNAKPSPAPNSDKRALRVEIWNEDLNQLLFWAFRYGLGRMTYAVGIIARAIIVHRDSLSEDHRRLICAEISEAIEKGHAGHACDVAEWQKVMEALNASA